MGLPSVESLPMKSLLLLLAACGSSATSGDWLPSDIEESQTLDRLGAAGYQKLCDAFEDYVRDRYRSDRLIQAACVANALQTTSDAVACGAAVESCLDMLPPAVETQLNQILAQASCNTVAVEPTGCSSRVSQLKACLDALGTEVDRIMFSLTCAAVGSPVPADWWMIDPPAACTAIAAEC